MFAKKYDCLWNACYFLDYSYVYQNEPLFVLIVRPTKWQIFLFLCAVSSKDFWWVQISLYQQHL